MMEFCISRRPISVLLLGTDRTTRPRGDGDAFLLGHIMHKINACEIQVRWMIRRDMPEVMEISSHHGLGPQWNEEEFLTHLRKRNVIGMVADHRDYVHGFMVYELLKNELNVLNFCVHQDYRRCGVGRRLADKLVSKLSPYRRNVVSVEVHEKNLGAQQFFAKCGYKATGVMRNHYEDREGDAYRMEYWSDYRGDIS